MLLYYFGAEKSFLFAVGAAGRTTEAYPLTLHSSLASLEWAPVPRSLDESLPTAERTNRSILVRLEHAKRENIALPARDAAQGKAPLNHTAARVLIDHYHDEISEEDFSVSRAIVIKSKAKERPESPQRPEMLADILVPERLRQTMRVARIERLIVIPDGALHKLPLEALLFEGAPEPRYGLDELPPITYAPSAAILALLAERPRPARPKELSLLTVGNPHYPQPGDAPSKLDPKAQAAILALQGKLPPLPKSAEESRIISGYFNKNRVVALEGANATEGNVVKQIPGKHIIHLAAHGYADERFSNLFGAIALAPPKGAYLPEDDGFLSLHEIYRLPLENCELAVLSACLTNVGPQRPMEAGITLANGFLNAGARRVIASHWSVADSSTASLMGTFFDEWIKSRDEPDSCARALQIARKKTRDHPGWEAPFHWAPFILIGAGD